MPFQRSTSSILTRRRFIGQASCAAVSSISVLNTLLNLRLAGDVAAADPPTPDEYRALVCLFLAGGNDSFNMLVPRGPSEYAEYAAVRQDLALAQGSLIPINPLNSIGKQLGVHPNMPELANLFEQGHAAFIANVGTLIQPVTKAQYNAGSVSLPLGLFSHSDQQEQWQTSVPQSRAGTGWAGRLADLLQSLNSNQKVSMNISLSGNNVFQSGQDVFEYAITPNGAVALAGYKAAWQANDTVNQVRSAAVDSQLSQQYSNLLMQAFTANKRNAVEAYGVFSGATSGALPPGVTFPATALGPELQMIAKTIAGRAALGVKRQTFFVQLGGWDHHDEVLVSQQTMLPYVSSAVGAFYNALVALGVENNVTLFTASDFGRTLTSNGRGSDHAWGGNHFVVGGGVAGQRIYGDYPVLAADSSLDVGRGRLIPTTSADAYFAELALWLGVSKPNLPLVLPNIGNFYSTGSSTPPLGFLL
jgi:uncharacterized protein (DUF1501 family)